MEMAEWTEEDEPLKLSDQMENVALVESAPFNNYLEEWEAYAVSTQNNTSTSAEVQICTLP